MTQIEELKDLTRPSLPRTKADIDKDINEHGFQTFLSLNRRVYPITSLSDQSRRFWELDDAVVYTVGRSKRGLRDIMVYCGNGRSHSKLSLNELFARASDALVMVERIAALGHDLPDGVLKHDRESDVIYKLSYIADECLEHYIDKLPIVKKYYSDDFKLTVLIPE